MVAGPDPLADLATSSADLTRALAELRSDDGLRETVGPDILRDAEVPDDVLDRFLSLAVREAHDRVLFGLALSLPACIAWRGAGTEALGYCLASNDLDDEDRGYVLERMAYIQVPGESVATRHKRASAASIAMNHFRTYYLTFLQVHIDDVLAECQIEFDTLVLDPAFPPVNYGLDCVILAIDRAADPTRYQQKAVQWVTAGDFESDPRTLQVFYTCMSDRLPNPRFAELRSAVHARLITLLRDPAASTTVWAHLWTLVMDRYAGATDLLAALRNSGIVLSNEQRAVLEYPLKALGALANGGVGHGKSFDHWCDLMLDNPPSDPRGILDP